jgi:glucose-6-phosphate 1-dehydrogenase
MRRPRCFSAIRPIKEKDAAGCTVRGQYRTYRDTPKASPPARRRPTFAAIRFYIDNWRWQGVPFYMRSGKALAAKSTEINILFKRPPHVMFPMPPASNAIAQSPVHLHPAR